MTDEITLPEGWALHGDMVQDDLERFEAEKDKADKDIPIGDNSLSAVARNNRRWVLAAIRAGWFKSCPFKADELGKQNPGDLAAAALAVGTLYWDSARPTEGKF